MPPISSQRSDRLDLPYLMLAQAQKHVTHNEALHHLDLVVQLVLEETERDTPPTDPGAGDIYAIGASPSGEWAGQGGAAGRLERWGLAVF